MERVLREMSKRGVVLKQLKALEVFGFTGAFHTAEYQRRVASLEVWEIDPTCEAALRRNLPGATVKITDSYQECRASARNFSLIVIDNPMSTYGEHCEHFGLFPDLLRLAEDPCVLIINVIPHIDASAKRKYPKLFNRDQLDRRSQFYDTNRPEHIALSQMVLVYARLAADCGFTLDWWFSCQRSVVHYLVLKISKRV